MRSWKALVSALTRWVGQLTVLHYRLVYLSILTGGAAVIYYGPVLRVIAVPSVAEKVRSELIALRAERSSLQKELLELEGKLGRVGTEVGGATTQHVGNVRRDLVQVIDNASRDSSVRIVKLQALGAGGAGVRNANQRYQLMLTGDYPNITQFIRTISGAQSPILVVEIAIAASGWAYPAQPLEARLLLETAPPLQRHTEPLRGDLRPDPDPVT
jgi:hypothetical protein